MEQDHTFIIEPGALFDSKYRIIKQLGTGAFGGVYMAEHTLMHKIVAIKMLHATHSENAEAIHRFQREAQAAGNIDHPNICAATDYGLFNNTYYIVMEYLDGRSLYEIETELGRFDVLRAIHIIKQVANALEKAHEVGIVHRDLKPENIVLIDHEGDKDFVKITDFGIAQIETKTNDLRLTQVGMVYGSPLYLSPEQARAEAIDHRADLYSVGIIFYELLTGQLPFLGESATVVLAKHVTEPPPTFEEIDPTLVSHEGIEQIIRKLLEKDPARRFQSATELRLALEEIESEIRQYGLGPRPKHHKLIEQVREKRKDRSAVRLIGIASLVLLLLIVGFFVVRYLVSDDDGGNQNAATQVDKNAETELFKEAESLTEEQNAVAKSREAYLASPLISDLLLQFDNEKDLGTEKLGLLFERNPEVDYQEFEVPTEAIAKNDLEKAHLHLVRAQRFATQKKEVLAIDELNQAVALEPKYAFDNELIKVVITCIQGRSKRGLQAATQFVEDNINPFLAKRLAQLAEHDQSKTVRVAALEMLETTHYFEKLPNWNQLTIRLRHAQSCEDNRDYIVKIGELGDPKAMGALTRFTAHPTTGCGPQGNEDCWECLRPQLREAVDRLQSTE